MRVAVCTNVYNEDFNLPIWLSHYQREFGNSSVFILDHGSSYDLHQRHPGVSIFRLPRTPFDDATRSRAVSNIVNGLLDYHDVVIYTDSDEILVADPRRFSSLLDMLKKTDAVSYTAIGVDVVQAVSEPEFVFGQMVSLQRSQGLFNRAMFKTLISRSPITWGGGFHSSTHEPNFGDVYLFHLKYVDLQASIKRLQVTRQMEWARDGFGMHQRIEDDELVGKFRKFQSLPLCEDFFSAAAIEAQHQYDGVRFSIWQQNYRLTSAVKHQGLVMFDSLFHGRF